MRAIRLRNIRSLADTGDIAIKPITLLLGQNSSGKSTVLRTLPLLKQSVRTRSNAPILWYGDLVDFGSAREVISTFARDQSISLEFDLGPIRLARNSYYYYMEHDAEAAAVRIAISLNEHDGRTRLRSFEISVEDDRLFIEIDAKGSASTVRVNDIDFTRLLSTERYRFSTSEVVPQLIRSAHEPVGRNFYPGRTRALEAVEREIRKFFTDRLPTRVRENTITKMLHRMPYRAGWKFVASLQDAATLKSTKDLTKLLSSEAGYKDFSHIRSLFMLWELPDILASIERKVTSTFSAVSYVGPSRATGVSAGTW